MLPLFTYAENVPSMFRCVDVADNEQGVFMVIIAEGHEAPFMLFDRSGNFMNKGVFKYGMTDSGDPQYNADIKTVHLLFTLINPKSEEARWNMVLTSKSKPTQILECD